VLYGFFQAVAHRGAELGVMLPPGQLAAAEAGLQAYWSAPVATALLGALERLLAQASLGAAFGLRRHSGGPPEGRAAARPTPQDERAGPAAATGAVSRAPPVSAERLVDSRYLEE
jgi:hypothetical protein